MKMLVTGGSGFLGSHVADALSAAGHEVVVFDRVNSPYLQPDQTMVIGDIMSGDDIRAAAKGCEAYYHFAAIADIAESMSNPRQTVSTNLMGTLNLLEVAVENKISRFVFASSIYVYSHQGSFYRTTKQACEQLIHNFQETYGLPFTILRFGSLYGPRAGSNNAVQRMLNNALRSGRIEYSGTGDEIREYIHVLDGAASSADILSPEYENEVVHLTGHERMQTRSMLEMIREILGGNVEIVLNSGERTGHYYQTPYSFNPRLGKKMLRPTFIDLGLGLLDCMDHIKRDMNDND